jgi:hypothetical protein
LPVLGLVCDATLAVFITGFIGVRHPLFFALGIA